MIAGLLLAAGRSTRFGADKLSAKLNGKAVIRWSVQVLSPLDVVYVVIPPRADSLTQALSRLDVRFVINLGRDEGIASSIRAGVAALPDEVDAVMIALADQPLGSAKVARALSDRWSVGGVAAVASLYRDGSGHPVLFGRECFEKLKELKGDVGARSLLRTLGERVAYVSVDADSPVDVDTPDVLALLQHGAPSGNAVGK